MLRYKVLILRCRMLETVAPPVPMVEDEALQQGKWREEIGSLLSRFLPVSDHRPGPGSLISPAGY